MSNRKEFLSRHPEFRPGMMACSTDGEQLGEIQKLDKDTLTIEAGTFFAQDFRVSYDEVADIRGRDVIISRSRTDLDEWRGEGRTGAQDYEHPAMEEAGTPLSEKDLEAERLWRESELPLEEEEVRARKQTRREQRDVGGEIRREDVEVERDRPGRER